MITRKTIGEFDGKAVDQFTLRSETGVEVDLLSWGVVVRDWRVPVQSQPRSVVLGFETFEPYPIHSPHFGCLVGRVVSRVRGASFELDGKTYALSKNEGANSLHGGPKGLGRVVWDAEADELANSVVFFHNSPDGAEGYPGTLQLTATYRLLGNKLRLDLVGTSDRPAPLSLGQHLNFNLGVGSDILDHEYWFAAGAYVELDADLLPTGNVIEASSGTKWDFRTPRTLRDSANQPIPYDASLVLDCGRNHNDPIARVTAPNDDLSLKLWSDRPALQFYNGVVTDVRAAGLSSKRYRQYSNFVLEDQAYPDALHHKHFPSIIVTPEKPYSHWCEFEIG